MLIGGVLGQRIWERYENRVLKSRVIRAGVITSYPKDVVLPQTVTIVATPTMGVEKQKVVISFDGSKSLEMWEETMELAREIRKKGAKANFTYFISGVYLLPYERRMEYYPPRAKPGESKIGFGEDEEEVKRRVELIEKAAAEGHEIGSHLNGHFSGSNWSEIDWKQELDEFDKLVNISGLKLNKTETMGIRVPNLGRNEELYRALSQKGYSYDVSGVGKETKPTLDQNGVWRIEIPSVNLAGTKKYPLSMDYNLYVEQSGAREVAKKGSKQWGNYYNQVVKSYQNYFNLNYQGTRQPVLFSHHFSKWNDGVYWEALKTTAREICGKAEVECISFRELVSSAKEKQGKINYER